MTLETSPARRAARLTIYIGIRDRIGHHSVATEVVKRARKAGLAGATVFEAVSGFGASGKAHETHVFSDDTPMSVVLVDDPDRIRDFVGSLDDIVRLAFVTVDKVEVLGQ